MSVNQSSLIPPEDATEAFFLSDTCERLKRMIEVCVAWWCFVVLLYVRFLMPTSWQWIRMDYFWVVIFLPLFVMDFQNYKYVRYVHSNSQHFPCNETYRCTIVFATECLFKTFLSLYLSVPSFRVAVYLQILMILYTAGYSTHLLLGHPASSEDDAQSAEGFNTISELVGGMGRFFKFAFVISVILKVLNISNYNWAAVFWPCWCLEGILALLLILLTPTTLFSFFLLDRSSCVMLTWIILSVGGLGFSCFLAMGHMASFLDDDLCVNARCEDTAAANLAGYHPAEELIRCRVCQSHLRVAMIPFIIFLFAFAVVTQLLKTRLATSLHDAWYRPVEQNGDRAPLAPPVVMFRVSATYYRRECDPHALDLDVSVSDQQNGTLQSGRYAWAQWVGSLGSSIRPHISASLRSRRICRVPRQDPYASYLSAQGSSFIRIAESNECGICCDRPPEAVLLECGHAGFCMECAENILSSSIPKCPICRQGISNIVRLRPDLPVPNEFFASWVTQDREGVSQRQLGSADRRLDSFDIEATEERQRIAAHATLAALEEAKAAADELSMPLAKPPWPSAAVSFAVMVDAKNRPERMAWWRLLFTHR